MNNVQDQLIHGVLHPSMYKFEPHLLVPCLSLQNLPHHDDFHSTENQNQIIKKLSQKLKKKYL